MFPNTQFGDGVRLQLAGVERALGNRRPGMSTEPTGDKIPFDRVGSGANETHRWVRVVLEMEWDWVGV